MNIFIDNPNILLITAHTILSWISGCYVPVTNSEKSKPSASVVDNVLGFYLRCFYLSNNRYLKSQG